MKFKQAKKRTKPNHYVTVAQIIDNDLPDLDLILGKDGSSLKNSIEMFRESYRKIIERLKNIAIKRDGPLGKIPNKVKKQLRIVKQLYINLREQRIEAIEIENLVNNLEEDGGFNHQTSRFLDIVENNVYSKGYDPLLVCTDGMHRILMAIICGVDKIKCQVLDEIYDATEEEIEKIEHDLFESANRRSAKVSDVTRKCAKKKSGNMSQKDKDQDNMFSDSRVRICVGVGDGAYGVHYSKTKFHYSGGGFDQWWNLLGVKSCKYYIGPDNFAEIRDYLQEVIVYDKLVDISIAYLLHIFDDNQKRKFLHYLKSNAFKNVDTKSWYSLGIHQNYIITVVNRLAVAFNEWHRNLFSDDIIWGDTIPFIFTLPREHQSFFVDGILRGFPTDPDKETSYGFILKNYEKKQQSTSQTNVQYDDSNLNEEFNI